MNITIDTNAAQKSSALGSAKMTGVDKTAKTSEKSDSAKTQTIAKNYDTLDLSESAVQYLAKTENENTSTETGTEDTDNAISEAASQLVSDSADSDTIDSSELYSYTDDQLSELLAKGEITQLEYNNEMAKRTTAETE